MIRFSRLPGLACDDASLRELYHHDKVVVREGVSLVDLVEDSSRLSFDSVLAAERTLGGGRLIL